MLEGDEHQYELHEIVLRITKNGHFDQFLSKSDREDLVGDCQKHHQEEEKGED